MTAEDPREQESGPVSPLTLAIRAGNGDQVTALLASGTDPNEVDALGYTPLHRAAMVDDASMVLTLLQWGADPSATSGQGKTFQDYLWMTPSTWYQGEARGARLAIKRWLALNDVADTEKGTA